MSKVINKINFGLIIFVIIISPLWLLLAVNLNLVNSTVPFYYYEILYFLIPLEIFIYVYK